MSVKRLVLLALIDIVDYNTIFAAIDASGWLSPLGAEYKVDGLTEESLHWLKNYTNKQ